MPHPNHITDEQMHAFAKAWEANGGSPRQIAEATGLTERKVYQWRVYAAQRGIVLRTAPSPAGHQRFGWQDAPPKWPKRREIEIKGGCAIIGSDAHFWPGIVTTAWRAYLAVSKQLKPAYQILNGDILDGAQISRHDRIAWEQRPQTKDEIECCNERLDEARKASPNSERLRTNGNHDTRFERYLSKHAPAIEGVKGSCLLDHFTGWLVSWSILMNPQTCPVMVKHAFRGGVHAVYNNTLHSGISIVTGHLHAQLIRPFTDYNGTRYGVDCGSLADVSVTLDGTGGPQFEYGLDDPRNHRSGFAVISFDEDGVLLPPELCEIQNLKGGYQRAVFRGKVVAEGECYREDVAA